MSDLNRKAEPKWFLQGTYLAISLSLTLATVVHCQTDTNTRQSASTGTTNWAILPIGAKAPAISAPPSIEKPFQKREAWRPIDPRLLKWNTSDSSWPLSRQSSASAAQNGEAEGEGEGGPNDAGAPPGDTSGSAVPPLVGGPSGPGSGGLSGLRTGGFGSSSGSVFGGSAGSGFSSGSGFGSSSGGSDLGGAPAGSFRGLLPIGFRGVPGAGFRNTAVTGIGVPSKSSLSSASPSAGYTNVSKAGSNGVSTVGASSNSGSSKSAVPPQAFAGPTFSNLKTGTSTSSMILNNSGDQAQDARLQKLDADLQKLVDAGQFKQAYQLMADATKETPSDARLWFNRGIAAARAQKWSEAKDSFSKAGTLSPALKTKSQIEYARACINNGEYQKAGELLWSLKGTVRADQTNERKIDGELIAIADERAISSPAMVASASDAQLLSGTANADRQRHTNDAVTLTREYATRNSTKSEAAQKYATALFKVSNYSEALAMFKKADDLDPSSSRNLNYMMACAIQLGQLEELQTMRQSFVARFPNDPRTKSIEQEISYYQRDFNQTRNRESQPGSKQTDRAAFGGIIMPLKVYVPDFSMATANWRVHPDPSLDCNSSIQKAMDDWTQASSARVSFQLTPNLEESNISIEYIDSSAGMAHSFAIGTTSVAVNSKGQPRKNIQLLVPTKVQASNNRVFYQTVTHEFGHALGLSHSSDPGDIMYFSELASSEPRYLSDADKRRINELYK